MRVLVLGGTGFIGSHVVDQLVAFGHEVRVLARGPERSRPVLDGVTYFQVDYRQSRALEGALSGCEAVLHTVSSTVPGTADKEPRSDVADNLIGLIGLMEMMAEQDVKRLIYISSGGTVYGRPDTVPISEGHPLRPISSYGIVKAAAESYVQLFNRSHGLSTLILRPSNPYGPRQGGEGTQGLVNTLMHRALSGETVEIWGDGTVVRDYLHVRDLARLCVLGLESGAEGVFNAGSGEGTSVREMISLVEQVSGRTLAVSYGQSRSVDVPVSVLDVSAARRSLGWNPGTSLVEGLAQTWAWHEEINSI